MLKISEIESSEDKFKPAETFDKQFGEAYQLLENLIKKFDELGMDPKRIFEHAFSQFEKENIK